MSFRGALRFSHSWARDAGPGLIVEERVVSDGTIEFPATVYRPAGGSHRGWVALHGITVPGRAHPSLQRFARALASAGNVVLVPEIRPWMELRVDPGAADRVIAAAAENLQHSDGVLPGGVGLAGFSFGATQALITAARPDMKDVVRAVLGFGGYCDPIATFRYSFTGEHEWHGIRSHEVPDPYGRWIVTANYLTAAPGLEGMQRVADAAAALAAEAGSVGVYAADAIYDESKARARSSLNPEEQKIWDLIAYPSDKRPPLVAARDLGERVARAALATHPTLDPRPVLPNVACPVVLAHGYHDQLIPFAETLALREHLPPRSGSHVTISRLFAHSKGAPPRVWQLPLEAARYVRLIERALAAG